MRLRKRRQRIGRCAPTRSATSTRCSRRPRRCSRPPASTLRCERSPKRPASASAPFTATFRSAPTSSRPSSVARSTPAPTPRRSWRPSTDRARRWRDGCSDTRPSSRPSAAWRRPCTRETRRSTPCPPTSEKRLRPALRVLLQAAAAAGERAPTSSRTNCWGRSPACACAPTSRARTRAAHGRPARRRPALRREAIGERRLLGRSGRSRPPPKFQTGRLSGRRGELARRPSPGL